MKTIEDKELNILALGLMFTLATFSLSLPNFGLGEIIDSMLLCFVIYTPVLILFETNVVQKNILEYIFVEISSLLKVVISIILFYLSYYVLDYIIHIDMRFISLIHLKPFTQSLSFALFALFFTCSQLLIFRFKKKAYLKASLSFQLLSFPIYIGIIQLSNSMGGSL